MKNFKKTTLGWTTIKSKGFWRNYRRDGEKFNIALDQCEEEYELEIHRKKQEFNEYMTMLNREMGMSL